MTNVNRLLLIDDEPDIRDLIRKLAEDCGFDVRDTGDGQEFLMLAAEWKPSCVILDLQVPGTDGVELLQSLRKAQNKAGVILVSGFDKRVLKTTERLAEDIGLRVLGALSKPWRAPQLRAMLLAQKSDAPSLTAGDLSRGIADEELFLVYQPKIDLKSGALEGAEALVRWRHPHHGVLTPNFFVPLAEEENLADDLSFAVIEQAAAQLAAWQKLNWTLSLAVNISGQNLGVSSFADRLSAIHKRHNIATEQVGFEVTETAAMSNATTAMDILSRLRLKGFSLSIDDFGTGHSSLVQLYRLPFNELKIDRQFVSECATSEEALVITRALINLARDLGLRSVAEGIETAEVVDVLAELGCDLGQGYFYSKPLPADEFADWATNLDKGITPING